MYTHAKSGAMLGFMVIFPEWYRYLVGERFMVRFGGLIFSPWWEPPRKRVGLNHRLGQALRRRGQVIVIAGVRD